MRQLLIAAIRRLLAGLTLVSPALAAKLAFALICYPASRAKLRSSEAAWMAQAEAGCIEVNGQQVVTYKWGDGRRPVLFVHGWESRSSRYAKLAERLVTRGYTAIAFDAPGHGDSPGKKTTIIESVEIVRLLHAKYGNFEAAVGHSFGVPCVFYSLKNQVRIGKIVAISGLSDFDYILKKLTAELRLKPSVTARIVSLTESYFEPLQGIWSRFSVTDSAAAITQPMLIIHDRHDSVVALSQAEKTARHFDKFARLHVTSNLGHHRILDDEAVLENITKFIIAADARDSATAQSY